MVATTRVQLPKNEDIIPASKVSTGVKKNPVSPTESPTSRTSSEEVQLLRAQNKVLTEALASIREAADKEMKKTYDLVWFARYRYRFPNHEACSRIDSEHAGEIEKLRGEDGDFHHGFNSGLLAATRLFKEKADILHINNFEELSSDLVEEGAKHSKKMEEARTNFPHIEVSNDFPHKK